MNRTIILILFLFITQLSVAQLNTTTKLSGKVTDAVTGSPVIGASVVITATRGGARTDVEGNFFLQVKTGETYAIEISSVGYQTKVINDIKALERDNAPVNISLEQVSAELNTVVVTSSARKEGMASLYTAQKNASAISDGISAEIIRKSPDRNTSEVLRRVSGTSIQDNKFVIIRGLSERYNSSLLNNTILPSTEPDKKAFSFDILPSSLVDNVTIYKSATPDLPGDFAGGAVKVATKDYPSKKLSEIGVSVGYNSLTTFRNFYKGYPEGSMDWLGFFDNKRLMPGSYYRHRGAQFINLDDAAKTSITKQFPNTFGYEPALQSQPNVSIAYTGGNTKLLGESKKIGYIYAINYNNSRRIADRYRNEYEQYNVQAYDYSTTNYDMRSTLSGLLNVTYAYGKSKISLKNLYNNDFVKTVGIRNGENVVNGESGTFLYKSTNSEAAANGILNTVLEGLHSLPHDWTVDWNASYGLTYRWQPDQRILTFHTYPGDGTYYLTLSNENSPEITNAGRVYSFLKENIYGANINVTRQFKWKGMVQKLKFGTSNYYRDRNVEVDALGFSVLNTHGYRVQIPEAKGTTYSNIFSPENIDNYHITLATIGANSTDYHGTGLLNAGYVMLDNKFSNKIKLTWGVRAERSVQQLHTVNRPDIQLDNFDVLPSGLFTYSVNNKTNIRLAASKSVNRPEFRELATYRVFDYENYIIQQGNDTLQRSKNTNADLRYEWFPAAGEIISASVFYKYFNSPIEQTNLANDVYSFVNATNAKVYGIELEIRKRLDFISGNFFNHLTFYTNAAYIKGSVKFGDVTYNSPMQGQSPYLVNGGLTYSTDNDALSFNILYNRIGPRLKFRAVGGAGKNVYEKPRDVLDASVSKKLLKNRMELRLTISDLLADAHVWYYKFDAAPKSINYNASTDRIMNSYQYGATTSLSIRYNLGK
ncbi:hypothetical protein FC093_17990 [Ilyomonas limi]|uniref:TonB-dependent receptor plug domain-containing protein n=1 Tax=Ilyomonas limi TaxID=2575867 RepID=A0A4U3KWU8_9BACT|nr:TonB-dependent receptor [Ilyomonas limi]TKK66144.1 hypothetical protein FC093_17990 [Ilyomonas limi]